MKQLLTVGVRSRFSLSVIEDMWHTFFSQLEEKPRQDLFTVGKHTEWKDARTVPYTHEVWVKIDKHPEGKVATMLLSDEW